jgi:hypothetical protein
MQQRTTWDTPNTPHILYSTPNPSTGIAYFRNPLETTMQHRGVPTYKIKFPSINTP